MDESKSLIKKSSINYGLILGGILAGTVALVYALSLETLTKWWLGIILFLVAIVIGITSVGKAKGILGGFISFKQAFSAYFITIAIGLFISVLMGIIIFAIIDPGAAEYLNEHVIEVSRSMMERFGASEADIEEAIAKMEGKNNYSVGQQLQSYVWQLVFYSVFGLLIALIMKRKDPNQAA